MNRRSFVAVLLGVVALCFAPSAGSAQQFALSTPFNTLNDNFFERIGMGFGFQLQGANPASGRGVVGFGPGGINPGGNIVFSQGGFNSALPQFGGHDANTDATLGFGLVKGGNGAFFNLAAGQGSTRSMTNQTPVIVLPNGVQGTISDTSQTPFVTSVIPVVGSGFGPSDFGLGGSGGGVRWVSPLQDRMERFYELQRQKKSSSAQRAEAAALELGNENLSREEKLSLKADASRGSSAGYGDLSVAEIKSQQAAEVAAKQQELAGLMERAKGAEEAGKANVAKIYYRQALARATGDLREEIQSKLQTLGR